MKMTVPAVFIALQHGANRRIMVLSEVLNSVYYLYDANFRDLRKLSKADVGKEMVCFVNFFLCRFF